MCVFLRETTSESCVRKKKKRRCGGGGANRLDLVLDPRLAGESCTCRDEMRRVLDVALLCASSLSIDRPSMRSVVKQLLEVSNPVVAVVDWSWRTRNLFMCDPCMAMSQKAMLVW
ncbi:unnamed protein product [Triticum turgidum subsp. durum]|uniref:Uncharacterized protein n=1 Tax=Triticum turgidum subsp. durum TaxID=4567 RepID=A0A9R1NKS8_TRITD|nr:unnamed protein product [Triticum turgidum subsp. durum]